MRWTSIIRWLIPLLVLAAPVTARADDNTPTVDARFVGYSTDTTFAGGSAAVDWFILTGLGLIGIGIMFIDSRRSHLD